MFPMRSRSKPRLFHLTSVSFALMVLACQGEVGQEHKTGERSQVASTGVEGTRVRHPTPANLADIPTLDPLHFNLHCETRAHVVSDSHPELQTGTYPIGLRSWNGGGDWVVDLQTMRFCVAPDECLHHSPRAIPHITQDRITLVEDPGVSTSVRRRDLRFQQRTEDGGRVTVETGRCVKQPFSGFPAVPRPV